MRRVRRRSLMLRAATCVRGSQPVDSSGGCASDERSIDNCQSGVVEGEREYSLSQLKIWRINLQDQTAQTIKRFINN